jgi:hypothetical protein
MNERILLLVEDAERYAGANSKETWGQQVGPAYQDLFNKKFAELIVKECVSILRKPEYPMTHPEELTDYNRGWVNGRLLGIEHIAYRFGVES